MLGVTPIRSPVNFRNCDEGSAYGTAEEQSLKFAGEMIGGGQSRTGEGRCPRDLQSRAIGHYATPPITRI